MRIFIILIALVIVGVTAIWFMGRATVGTVHKAVEQVADDRGNDERLPGSFDTPDLFSNLKDSGQTTTQDQSVNEREAERLEDRQQMIKAQDELQQQQARSPYDAEIQRLEDERRLLEAQQNLEEQKAKSMPPILPERMPRPVTDF